MPDQPEAFRSAQSRVGSTPTSRVRWLLEFAKLDLSQIPEHDLLPVQREVFVFLGQAEDVLSNQPLDKDRILDGQRRIAMSLKALSRGKPWKTRITANLIVERKDARITSISTHTPATQDPWALFQFHAITALTQGADSLRFCANVECSQLYLRNKRQEYCSTRCRDAVNKRLYRQNTRQRETLTSQERPRSEPETP